MQCLNRTATFANATAAPVPPLSADINPACQPSLLLNLSVICLHPSSCDRLPSGGSRLLNDLPMMAGASRTLILREWGARCDGCRLTMTPLINIVLPGVHAVQQNRESYDTTRLGVKS